jgi:hypothetical protein
MPRNTSNIGSLEVIDAALPPSVQLKLNDRLRRIADALGLQQAGSGTTSSVTNVNQLVFFVPGTLGILSDAAPAITVPENRKFSELVALLKQPPQGAPVAIQFYVNGQKWGASISLSGTSAKQALSNVASIPADQVIRMDITQVGSTFPGSDLTVILR